MTNLPKELEEIRNKGAEDYGVLIVDNFHSLGTYKQADFKEGFNLCYQSMLKTHVPKEKVEKLVEALIEMKNMLWTKQAEIHRVLKEFEGENE